MLPIKKTIGAFALLAALAVIAMTTQSACGGEDFLLNHNEDYGVMLNMTRLWVEYENLPAPAQPLSVTDQAQIARDWAQLKSAGDDVVAAWQQAFRSDPLLYRALACLNRLAALDGQYQNLRREIRRRYGIDSFREFEKQGSRWVQTCGQPWLNLQDERLVGLCLWWESLTHARESMNDFQDIPAGKLPTSYYAWLKTTEPYASGVIDKTEALSEARAIEVYRDGIDRGRVRVSAEHRRIDAQLSWPPGMRHCLRLQLETQYLYMLGDSYLQVHIGKQPSIAPAEARFEHLLGRVATIRPDVLIALHRANRATIEKQARNQQQQHNALQLALQSETTGSLSHSARNGATTR